MQEERLEILKLAKRNVVHRWFRWFYTISPNRLLQDIETVLARASRTGVDDAYTVLQQVQDRTVDGEGDEYAFNMLRILANSVRYPDKSDIAMHSAFPLTTKTAREIDVVFVLKAQPTIKLSATIPLETQRLVDASNRLIAAKEVKKK